MIESQQAGRYSKSEKLAHPDAAIDSEAEDAAEEIAEDAEVLYHIGDE